MRAYPVAAVLLGLVLLTGCDRGEGATTAGGPSPASPDQLAREACGGAAARGGPLPPKPLGVRWLPDIGSYDAARLLNHTNARIAGEAAARDAAWGPLASAWRDLADIYETARAEYAAALEGRATPEERRHLQQLQQVAAGAVRTIQEACRAGSTP